MKLPDWVYVAVGAILGTWLRYFVTSAVDSILSTLFVNMLGSFLLAALYCFLERQSCSIEQNKRYKLTFAVGVLGSFTTFSAISMESLSFIQQGNIMHAMLYIICSFIGGIIFAFVGYKLTELYLTSKRRERQ